MTAGTAQSTSTADPVPRNRPPARWRSATHRSTGQLSPLGNRQRSEHVSGGEWNR
ncbi:hypothetical protein [Actinokineospora sp. NPDC004072]